VANLLSAALDSINKEISMWRGLCYGCGSGLRSDCEQVCYRTSLAGGPTVDRASSVTMVQRLDPDPYDNFWFVN